jgi:hypothetical protein
LHVVEILPDGKFQPETSTGTVADRIDRGAFLSRNRVISVGEMVPGIGAVEKLGLFDSLNTKGQIAFWVDSDLGQSIVRGIPNSLDLDVDSDNTAGLGMPERDLPEDRVENKPDELGKVVALNEDDSDLDGVPDYADGYNLRPEVAFGSDDVTTGERFLPMVLEVPEVIDMWNASFMLRYSANDPLTDVIVDQKGGYLLDGKGTMRVWSAPGDAQRNGKDLGEGGNFIRPHEAYSALQLGLNADRKIVLWVEALRAVEEIADPGRSIEVLVDPDGFGPKPFVRGDALLVTGFTTRYVRVNDDGSLTTTDEVEPMLSSPTVSLSQPEVGPVKIDETGQFLSVTIRLKGTVDDPLSDLEPGDAGAIREVGIFWNGSSEPVATLPVSVSKSLGTGSLIHPFDYSGSFDEVVTVPVEEGMNWIRIKAENIEGQMGYAEFGVEIVASPIEVETHAVVLSLSAPLRDNVQDVVIARLTHNGQVNVAVPLIETTADSRVFRNSEAPVEIGLTGFDYVPNQINLVTAAVTYSPFGLNGVEFLMVQREAGELEFVGLHGSDLELDDNNYEGRQVSVRDVTAVVATETLPARVFLTKLIAPKELIQRVKNVNVGGEEFKLVTGENGVTYVSQPNRGGAGAGVTAGSFQFRLSKQVDKNGRVPVVTNQMPSVLDTTAGVVVGLGQAAWSFATGLVQLGTGAVSLALGPPLDAVGIKFPGYAETVQSVKVAVEGAKVLLEGADALATEYLEAKLAGDETKLRKLGGTYQEILHLGVELFAQVTDSNHDGEISAYEAGKMSGRIIGEFVSWGTVALKGIRALKQTDSLILNGLIERLRQVPEIVARLGGRLERLEDLVKSRQARLESIFELVTTRPPSPRLYFSQERALTAERAFETYRGSMKGATTPAILERIWRDYHIEGTPLRNLVVEGKGMRKGDLINLTLRETGIDVRPQGKFDPYAGNLFHNEKSFIDHLNDHYLQNNNAEGYADLTEYLRETYETKKIVSTIGSAEFRGANPTGIVAIEGTRPKSKGPNGDKTPDKMRLIMQFMHRDANGDTVGGFLGVFYLDKAGNPLAAVGRPAASYYRLTPEGFYHAAVVRGVGSVRDIFKEVGIGLRGTKAEILKQIEDNAAEICRLTATRLLDDVRILDANNLSAKFSAQISEVPILEEGNLIESIVAGRLLTEAIVRLRQVSPVPLGIELKSISLFVKDLPGDILGQVVGSDIFLDHDAAGWGWFLDPTPAFDEEYSEFVSAGRRTAITDGTASGRIDLLTVLMHEVGHSLGLEHHIRDWLMDPLLDVGTRASKPIVLAIP